MIGTCALVRSRIERQVIESDSKDNLKIAGRRSLRGNYMFV